MAGIFLCIASLFTTHGGSMKCNYNTSVELCNVKTHTTRVEQRHSGGTTARCPLVVHTGSCPDQLRVSPDTKKAVSSLFTHTVASGSRRSSLGAGAVGAGSSPDHEPTSSATHHSSFTPPAHASPSCNTTPGTSGSIGASHVCTRCHRLEGTGSSFRYPGVCGAGADGPPAVASTRRVTRPADAARVRMSRGTLVAMVCCWSVRRMGG